MTTSSLPPPTPDPDIVPIPGDTRAAPAVKGCPFHAGTGPAREALAPNRKDAKPATTFVALRKLQASEQRYRSLSACSPIGILEMDVAGRCLYANPHWQAITGLSADESLGAGWRSARWMSATERPSWKNGIQFCSRAWSLAARFVS